MGIGTKSGIIAASAGSAVVATQKVFRDFTLYMDHDMGPNATTGDWQSVVSRSDSQFVLALPSQSVNSFRVHTYPQSGRGSTIYKTGRNYMSLSLSGSNGITGSITAADLFLPISKSSTGGAGTSFGIAFNIFAGGSGSLSEVVSGYSLYVTASKTAYATSQTVNATGLFTYSLNATAITALNNHNNFGGSAPEINFAIIHDFDFTGTAPTQSHGMTFAITGSQLAALGLPTDYTVGPTVGSQFLPPRLELTYIPD